MSEEPDWSLPGMEEFSEREVELIKRSITQGDIVKSIHCLGWGFWPVENHGYYDERWLRKIADFIEIQNKPFWDEYNKYCEEDERNNPIDDVEIGICFPDRTAPTPEGERT